MRHFLSRFPTIGSALLALAVCFVALAQIILSSTGPLTPWKGGGFGMYTTPHVDARQVWLILPEGRSLRLFPADDHLQDWTGTLAPRSAGFVRDLLRDADQMRYYPREGAAEDLLERAARVAWPIRLSQQTGASEPTIEDQRLDRNQLSIRVTEMARRPSVGQLEQYIVFTFADEAKE